MDEYLSNFHVNGSHKMRAMHTTVIKLLLIPFSDYVSQQVERFYVKQVSNTVSSRLSVQSPIFRSSEQMTDELTQSPQDRLQVFVTQSREIFN